MSAEGTRSGWVDTARGLGIVLVVYGHVVGGLVEAGLLPRGGGFAQSYFVLYTFHMPLFFCLSGLFVGRAMARGAGPVLRQMGQRLVWPYLLWSSVQLGVMSLAAGHLNGEVQFSAQRLLALPWRPTSQFWFLQSLVVLQLLALLLWRRVGAPGLLCCALGLLALPLSLDLPVWLAHPCRFAAFFALGALAQQLGWVEYGEARHGQRALAALLALVALLACAALALQLPARGFGHWHTAALPCAMLGLLACLTLARVMPGPLQRGLAVFGRSAMPIFILHILFAAGLRVLLVRGLHLDMVALLLPLQLATGLLAPLLCERLLRPTGLLPWLGLGR